MFSKKSCSATFALAMILALPSVARAADTGLPWERVIQILVDSLTGPVVRGAIIVAIVVFGIAIALDIGGGGVWRKVIQLIFGLSIAAGAVSIVATLLPVTSGATF